MIHNSSIYNLGVVFLWFNFYNSVPYPFCFLELHIEDTTCEKHCTTSPKLVHIAIISMESRSLYSGSDLVYNAL